MTTRSPWRASPRHRNRYEGLVVNAEWHVCRFAKDQIMFDNTIVSQTTTTNKAGSAVSLNVDTPYGLFEARSGNKYIVTEDRGTRIAVALVHDSLPPFTWLTLEQKPLEQGHWWGPYQLRLTHKRAKSHAFIKAGVIQVGDSCAVIDCLDVHGDLGCISLGTVGDIGTYYRDHDGWAVELLDSKDVFFELVHPTSANLTVEPKPELTLNQRRGGRDYRLAATATSEFVA